MVNKGINYISLSETQDTKKLHTKRKLDRTNDTNNKSIKLRKYDFDYNLPGPVRLHKEIENFINELSPKPKDEKIRNDVINRIKKVTYSLWPHAKVEVFGSCLTGLYLPSSDIDVVVIGRWKHKPLNTLCDALVFNGVALHKNAYVVDKAVVPIVKFVDKLTNLKVDISFNVANGLCSAKLIKSYLNEYPSLKPLVILLKQFLLERDLNEVYRGGVGSYTLTLMIVNFLQLHPRDEGRLKNANLGVLLMEFFELYGLHLNYSRTNICLSEGGRYFKRNNNSYSNDKLSLSVTDPICEDNDVARGSYNMFKVQMAFKHAYKILSNAMADIHTRSNNYPQGILPHIFRIKNEERNHQANLHERSIKKKKRKL